jgi:uncharacterized oxidoreductase
VPELHAIACDVSAPGERDRLLSWTSERFSSLNLLVNNAGIQREMDFLTGASELFDGESEIDINLTAAIHLSALLIPRFLNLKRDCAIVNVTSGLAFIPVRSVPVYCATKAALHAFSMALRSQMAGTRIRVFELIPPIVRTRLHRGDGSREQAMARGIEPEEVAEKLIEALQRDRYEFAIGQARDLKVAARIAPHFFHHLLNKAVAG